jgi:hypothetical protein
MLRAERAIMLVSRCRCKEPLVRGPAHEPITSSCGSAWPGRFRLEQEEQLLPLRRGTSRALRGVRRCRSREVLAGQTEPIAHSCVSVWRAKFDNLSIAAPRSGHKSERAMTQPECPLATDGHPLKAAPKNLLLSTAVVYSCALPASSGRRLLNSGKQLIFGRQLEIILSELFGANRSQPATFLRPLRIGLPIR